MSVSSLQVSVKKAAPFLILILVGLLLYFQTLFFSYTGLDDSLLARQNEAFNSLRNIGQIFSSDAFFSESKLYYRPVLNLTYLLDANLGGYQAYLFHLSNILLHIAAAILVFILLKLLLERERLALWLALLFTVHPALAQAVAWLPGRNDILLLIFVLVSFISARVYSKTGRLKPFIIYLGLFFLALLTKENAIFLPVVMAAYWLTIGRDDKLSKEAKGLFFLGSVVIIIIWLLIRDLALAGGSGLPYGALFSVLPASLLMAFKVSYQAIFPWGLAPISVSRDVPVIYSLLIWPLFCLALYFARSLRAAPVWFGAAWFLIFFLLPFLFSSDAYFSHRLYLPLVGLLIIVAELFRSKNWEFKGQWVVPPLIIVLIFSSLAFSFSRSFRDQTSFALTSATAAPHSWMAQANLGVAYLDSGQDELAVTAFESALILNPPAPIVRYNLGLAYFRLGDLKAAQSAWEEELMNNPGYGPALSGLGRIRERKQVD